MRKLELADRLAKRLGIRRDEAFSIISNTVDVIKESLAGGNEVRLTGLGKFSPELRGGQDKKDFFRGGKSFVSPYVRIRFRQFSTSKYEILAENKDFWELIARRNGRSLLPPPVELAPTSIVPQEEKKCICPPNATDEACEVCIPGTGEKV